jgi:hypothetical protein
VHQRGGLERVAAAQAGRGSPTELVVDERQEAVACFEIAFAPGMEQVGHSGGETALVGPVRYVWKDWRGGRDSASRVWGSDARHRGWSLTRDLRPRH